MKESMKDKVVLITGGASGMGKEMAVRLAAQGARVVIADLNQQALEAMVAASHQIRALRCDVTDPAAVQAMVETVERDIGPIFRLTVSAGVMPAGSVSDMAPNGFARAMRINYEGLVYSVKAALPHLLQRRQGQIVLLGSLAGEVFSQNFAAYGASKAAVNAFGEVLTEELRGSGVQVLTVRPAAVATPLIEQATGEGGLAGLRKQARSGRMATPETIIDAIENALRSGRHGHLHPTAEARIGSWVRRLAPGLAWRIANASQKAG
jgi:NAD(P)-dependent dehydrogenase (short-subunit alcohol dehydrogenase family)